MNFFEYQERAKRRTSYLVFLFVLAVIGIIACVYFAVLAAFYWSHYESGIGPGLNGFQWWRQDLFAGTASAVVLIVCTGTLFKISALSEGGSAVARMLGGKRILPDTSGADERQLLNIVEEMSIASGIPVPPVYRLAGEGGINAFAAGFSQRDAVIGVTEGAMRLLSRDELQGVIAHEFSHILNGDMRINLRLIGVLNGILVLAVAGRSVLYIRGGSRRSRGGGSALLVIYLIGLTLCLVGYIGVFFGRLIKCAVARERENLADASAVQFTRNPAGLAGALKKIGGLNERSFIRNPKAEEASHMFFSESIRYHLSALFATHPPLDKRIRLLDPSFDGKFPVVNPLPSLAPAPQTAAVKRPAPAFKAAAASSASLGEPAPVSLLDTIGTLKAGNLVYALELLESVPENLMESARETLGARALVYALLMEHSAAEKQEAQLRFLFLNANNYVYQHLLKIYKPVSGLERRMYLPLIDLALPALSLMSLPQYEIFRKNVDYLINRDHKLDFFEMILRQIVIHYLDTHFGKKRPALVKYNFIREVWNQAAALLTMLAQAGAEDQPSARKAFQAAADVFQKEQTRMEMQTAPVTPERVEMCLSSLALTAPKVKEQFMRAAVIAARCDSRICVKEAELLRAFASALDCPLPPFPPAV